MVNIEPTLNDHQVMQFIHNGYITLESIVGEDFNRECESVPGGHLTDFVLTNEFSPKRVATSRSCWRGTLAVRRGFPRADERAPSSV